MGKPTKSYRVKIIPLERYRELLALEKRFKEVPQWCDCKKPDFRDIHLDGSCCYYFICWNCGGHKKF